MRDPCIVALTEHLLYLQCLQRTLACGIFPLLPTKLEIGCGHQPCAMPDRFQKVTDQIGGGGFSIGAGNANRAKMCCWIFVKCTGEIRQCDTYIRNFYIWERCALSLKSFTQC